MYTGPGEDVTVQAVHALRLSRTGRRRARSGSPNHRRSWLPSRSTSASPPMCPARRSCWFTRSNGVKDRDH